MKNVDTIFSIENCYKGNIEHDFCMEKINKSVPIVIQKLLQIERIKQDACFVSYDFSKIEFDIIFIDDQQIRQINKEYRNKDVATDVITFALFADDENRFVLDGSIYLGEILLSLDTAARQAKDNVTDEILLLVTHGILHLFGFDHMTDADYNFIVTTQKSVIEVL